MDMYGDHLLHCQKGTHRIRRRDAQVRLLQVYLKQAARHAVLEPRPFGSAQGTSRHQRIRESRSLRYVRYNHPLSPARIRDGLENPLTPLKNTREEKIRRFRRIAHASATSAKLFPMPISTLGGWHPDVRHARGTIAVNIASRALRSLHYARATFFQRRAALLVTNNAVCLMSGVDFEV